VTVSGTPAYSSNRNARLARSYCDFATTGDACPPANSKSGRARIGVIDRVRSVRDSLQDHEAKAVVVPILMSQ
jgi:hypothetical protein